MNATMGPTRGASYLEPVGRKMAGYRHRRGEQLHGAGLARLRVHLWLRQKLSPHLDLRTFGSAYKGVLRSQRERGRHTTPDTIVLRWLLEVHESRAVLEQPCFVGMDFVGSRGCQLEALLAGVDTLGDTLERLSLVDCALDGAACAALSEYIRATPALVNLDLSHSLLTVPESEFFAVGDLLDAIAASKTLEQLSLLGSFLDMPVYADILDQLADNFGQHPSLRSLAIGCGAPNDLQASMELDRVDGSLAMSPTISAMSTNTTLRHLVLANCGLGPGPPLDAIRDLLDGNRTLLGLDLGRNPLGPEGAAQLAPLLGSNATLQQLSLYGCQLGSDGVSSICEALADHISISRVDLGMNVSPIMYPSQESRLPAAKAVADLIEASTTLRGLSYSNNIAREAILPILKAMKTSRSLTELDIHGNNIGDGSARALVDMIAQNLTLTRLNVAGGQMSSMAAEMLIFTLKSAGPDLALTSLNVATGNMFADSQIRSVMRLVAKNARRVDVEQTPFPGPGEFCYYGYESPEGGPGRRASQGSQRKQRSKPRSRATSKVAPSSRGELPKTPSEPEPALEKPVVFHMASAAAFVDDEDWGDLEEETC